MVASPDALQFEIVAGSLDGESEVLKLAGQPDAEGGLMVRGGGFDVLELAGLPTQLLIVPGRVEGEDVTV